MEALALVVTLLGFSVDWTKSKEEVQAQVVADDKARFFMAMLQAGRVQFMKMEEA